MVGVGAEGFLRVIFGLRGNQSLPLLLHCLPLAHSDQVWLVRPHPVHALSRLDLLAFRVRLLAFLAFLSMVKRSTAQCVLVVSLRKPT